MAIVVKLILNDISRALLWQSLSISESIGQPDTLALDLFEIDEDVRTLVGEPDNYLYCHVYRDADLLFSGLVMGVGRRNDHGAVTYTLRAQGWQFLASKRLVGRPNGDVYEIQQDEDVDRLPTAVAIDPSSTSAPTPAQVQALFTAYWSYPVIDTDTYVTDILPALAPVEEVTFSGTDMQGAMDTLCAAGSAAALWWIANDSPDPGNTTAPNLALHFGLIELPADGDPLVSGLEAPYAISDTPDGTTSIMASAVPEIDVEHGGRVDSVYVRGATGFTQPVVPGVGAFPYDIGATVVEGGSGWVGSFGGIWGEAYVDAPVAISPEQRDAFGAAYRAAHGIPAITGTIPVDNYHGWHKGQAVMVTDAGLGLSEHWLLIRSVSIKTNDPAGEAVSYVLNVGDMLTPSLGYALRQQRLAEQRKEIAPATKFIPYVGDLALDPDETTALTMQLATAAGTARAVKGVGAAWHLKVNGTDITDPTDAGELFYLTDIIDVTDAAGQITATLHAGAITAADACTPWAEIAAA